MPTTAARALSMPAGQPVELLVSRGRGAAYSLPATYVGDFVPGTDEPPRRLTAAERTRVGAAARKVADAIAGQPVDELELNDATELLHRLSALTQGEPRFRLADGRTIGGERVSYRAALY